MSKIAIIILFFTGTVLAQETNSNPFYLEGNYFYGSLIAQNKNVAHLVRNQPTGFTLSYNEKTFGEKYWQEAYGYPDWGISFIYEDFNSDVLGENLAIYGHFNFYFFKRNLQLTVGEGIGLTTSPFNLDNNFKNNAFGSRVLASTYLKLNYIKPNLYKGIGFQAGLAFVHHSNGSFRAPNAGTNIFAINAGLNYTPETKEVPDYISSEEKPNYREPIAYNIFVRGGINEGDIVGLGQDPFLIVGAFADKRLNYKSTIQLGTEIFFSRFLKTEIEYRAISFPSSNLTGDEDYKRVGVFVGHELRLGRFALPTQLGYYVYWPYEYELPVYARAGVKYYFTDKIFGVATVKSHAANAEAIEFGVGVRL